MIDDQINQTPAQNQAPPVETPLQKPQSPLAKIWATLKTPEERSAYAKECARKGKERKAKKNGSPRPYNKRKVGRPRKSISLERFDEMNAVEQSHETLSELVILLGDVLTMLEGMSHDGSPGAKQITGRDCTRDCLIAAHSLIMRGLSRLNISGSK